MLRFGTKADTLASLEGALSHARVLPLVSFTVSEWEDAPARILDDATQRFGEAPCIVRSSCKREDTAHTSAAGAYLSVPKVHGREALRDAVDRVIASYDPPSPTDQVFIQPMLEQVSLCGVALTREPATGAHYVIINYDDSGETDSVTSGRSCQAHTFVYAKSGQVTAPPPLDRVIALTKELEARFSCDHLDIEFALDARGDCYLFQVRPLVLPERQTSTPADQAVLLSEIERTIARGMRPHPYLHGARTAYGVMPDWNPAEIIGIRPRPLALSLYRELVTDSIWSYQRNNYGYKNLRSFPLMLHFFGLPYIDVRVSLNSFIPSDIDGDLADRLANYYLDRLLAAPALHDKVEFEIVFSCYTLDLPHRLAPLAEHGFSPPDLQTLTESLRRLTNRIIRPGNGLWQIDRDKMDTLQTRHARIMHSDLDDAERIYWLLEDCKRYGTLPFAGLARAAFIAVQMLQSLVAEGIITPAERDRFMGGLSTVGSQIARDYARMSRSDFLSKYGHLRPGTYDILSARYDEAPDLYFDWTSRPEPAKPHDPFMLSVGQMKDISRLLAHHGLEYDVVGLLEFISSAIEWREHSKFLFTRHVSDALALFKRLGERLGFSADDLSYANIQIIAELVASSRHAKYLIAASVAQGRAMYDYTQQLRLPPLITSPQDVWGFMTPPFEPNFITRKHVVAGVAHHTDKARLDGAIAVIESADPGFDWLFSHPIAGLITAYGGANSHMAVRAGELGLPAVIGAGETLFRQWSLAKILKLDCANRQVEVVQ